MPTYRERREARAARLREWADKRAAGAAADLEAGAPYRGDTAFNTQPGYIPARARVIAREDRGHRSMAKARSMEARADSITRATEAAIYDDDPDAVERLRDKLAGLEREREAVKAANAAARAAGRPGAPAYVLRNLGGNITRTRQRLDRLQREREREAAGVPERPRWISARFSSTGRCGHPVVKGDWVLFWKRAREVECPSCSQTTAANAARQAVTT